MLGVRAHPSVGGETRLREESQAAGLRVNDSALRAVESRRRWEPPLHQAQRHSMGNRAGREQREAR